MNVTVVAALLVTTACTSTATLSSDEHYVGFEASYSSPEDCLAQNADFGYPCLHSISLCKSGRFGMRSGDIVSEGTYDLNRSVAEITLDDGAAISFDLETSMLVGSPDSAYTWVPDTEGRWDTLQFDNIDCSQPMEP
jgi:hypothetical protein